MYIIFYIIIDSSELLRVTLGVTGSAEYDELAINYTHIFPADNSGIWPGIIYMKYVYTCLWNCCETFHQMVFPMMAHLLRRWLQCR